MAKEKSLNSSSGTAGGYLVKPGRMDEEDEKANGRKKSMEGGDGGFISDSTSPKTGGSKEGGPITTAGVTICPLCEGRANCPECGGEGEIEGKECKECKGSGDCPNCEGSGMVDKLTRTHPKKSIKKSRHPFDIRNQGRGWNVFDGQNRMNKEPLESKDEAEKYAEDLWREQSADADRAEGARPKPPPKGTQTGGTCKPGQRADITHCKPREKNMTIKYIIKTKMGYVTKQANVYSDLDDEAEEYSNEKAAEAIAKTMPDGEVVEVEYEGNVLDENTPPPAPYNKAGKTEGASLEDDIFSEPAPYNKRIRYWLVKSDRGYVAKSANDEPYTEDEDDAKMYKDMDDAIGRAHIEGGEVTEKELVVETSTEESTSSTSASNGASPQNTQAPSSGVRWAGNDMLKPGDEELTDCGIPRTEGLDGDVDNTTFNGQPSSPGTSKRYVKRKEGAKFANELLEPGDTELTEEELPRKSTRRAVRKGDDEEGEDEIDKLKREFKERKDKLKEEEKRLKDLEMKKRKGLTIKGFRVKTLFGYIKKDSETDFTDNEDEAQVYPSEETAQEKAEQVDGEPEEVEYTPKHGAQFLAGLSDHARAEDEHIKTELSKLDNPELSDEIQGEYHTKFVAPRQEWLKEKFGKHYPDHDIDSTVKGMEEEATGDYGFPQGHESEPGEQGDVELGEIPTTKNVPFTHPSQRVSNQFLSNDTDENQEINRDMGGSGMVAMSAGNGTQPAPFGQEAESGAFAGASDPDTEEILQRYQGKNGKWYTKVVARVRKSTSGKLYVVKGSIMKEPYARQQGLEVDQSPQDRKWYIYPSEQPTATAVDGPYNSAAQAQTALDEINKGLRKTRWKMNGRYILKGDDGGKLEVEMPLEDVQDTAQLLAGAQQKADDMAMEEDNEANDLEDLGKDLGVPKQARLFIKSLVRAKKDRSARLKQLSGEIRQANRTVKNLTDMGKFQSNGGKGSPLSKEGKVQHDGGSGSALTEEGDYQREGGANYDPKNAPNNTSPGYVQGEEPYPYHGEAAKMLEGLRNARMGLRGSYQQVTGRPL